MKQEKIAVLGLGIIGSIWAKHYQGADQLAAVWNRSPKPDLDFNIQSLEKCAHQADFLQLCLYDANSVRSVLSALLPFLKPKHLIIQSSTIDSESAEEFAKMIQATGASYLEAPFTGSKPAAEAQQTVFFLGGSQETLKRAEPVLKTTSSTRYYIGSPAQAATIKLAMNLQIAGISQALCESITMSRSSGISDELFFQVMKKNVSWSGLAALKEPKIRNADFGPQFSVKNLHKDMRLAKLTAQSNMPLLDVVIECLAETESDGLGEEDFIAMLKKLSP